MVKSLNIKNNAVVVEMKSDFTYFNSQDILGSCFRAEDVLLQLRMLTGCTSMQYITGQVQRTLAYYTTDLV